MPGLTFHVLQPDGRLAPSLLSRSFPQVRAADIACFLAMLGQQEENEILRQFRAWLRTRPGGQRRRHTKDAVPFLSTVSAADDDRTLFPL